MAKQESKELEVKKSAELTTYDQADWGASNAENRDMLLPRLALMHGTSKLVVQEKANPGDIVNTATGKVIAQKGQSVEVIPIKMLPKTWVVSLNGKWKRTELMPPGEEREWEQETPEGTEKHERCLNFYVLVRSELTSGEAMPHLLSFKGTAFRSGQKLVNHFILSRSLKKAPARTAWKVSSVSKSNDANTWRVLDVEETSATTQEELAQSYQWLQNLKAYDDSAVTRYEQETEGEGSSGGAAHTRNVGEVRAGDQF